MTKEKKNILARLVSAGALLLPLALSTVMLITIIAKTDEMDYIINVISLAVLILFTIVEIVILLKNLKSDLIIKSLIYNTNDTINTGGLIINNVFLLTE